MIARGAGREGGQRSQDSDTPARAKLAPIFVHESSWLAARLRATPFTRPSWDEGVL
jgi:hypothetical protein